MANGTKAHRPSYQTRFDQLEKLIREFERSTAPLPGILDHDERSVFINQLIDSERRNQHFERMLDRPLSSNVADPHSIDFDPLRAAIYHWRAGNKDESYWLIFQFVHFGKHPTAGWRYVREVYGRLNSNPIWTWEEISANTPEFRLWLGESQVQLLRRDEPRGFGNHRKYSSLSHESHRGTASVFESYVEWVMGYGSHAELFAQYSSLPSPQERFDALYKAMKVVLDFGRIARFDYLMTLSRLDFLDVKPGCAYLKNATGPLQGARLLITGPQSTTRAEDLEKVLKVFAEVTGTTFDVIEDAICNWQKSPGTFRKFVL
ncbi:alpha-glutamyl/putrescinyl thymine pyrophosphorylase clade 3 protein (plasmid) [Paenarthrobacter ureafaciens]